MNLKTRTDLFWEHFQKQEEQLHQLMVQPDNSNEIVSKLDEIFAVLGENILFHAGGDHEITFTVSGDHWLFYIYPYVVSKKPNHLKYHWTFLPYNSKRTDDGPQSFQMNGCQIPLKDISILANYNNQTNKVDIQFYEKNLCALEENACYDLFYTILDISCNELITHLYIGTIERAPKKKFKMFPLTQLDDKTISMMQKESQEVFGDPLKKYTAYQFNASEQKLPRFDIISGITCYPELVNDYFSEEPIIYDGLAQMGAEAVYIFFPFEDEDMREILKLRYELEDALTQNVLGTAGSGSETGVLLGGAMAEHASYIDLLLFDKEAFLEKAVPLLKNYARDFYLGKFIQNGEVARID